MLILCLGAAPSRADLVLSADGMSNPGRTVTFAEIVLPNFTPLTDQYAEYGVTFSNLFYNPAPFFNPAQFGIPNLTLPDIGNFVDPSPSLKPVTINFLTPQTSVAFSLITDVPATATFTALFQGAVVETDTLSTLDSLQKDVYVYSGVTIDQIRITTTVADGGLLIDNLQLSAVPEPSSLVLVIAVASAGGVGYWWRRGRGEVLSSV